MADPGKRIRDGRHHGHDRDRHGKPCTGRMLRVPRRCGPGKQREPGRHDADGRDLAPSHGLVQHPRAESEQEDEAQGEGRLHQGQRDHQQRSDLSYPSGECERRP